MQMSMGNTTKSDIVLRRLPKHVDVFFGGNGWQPWARFKLKQTKNGIFLEHEEGDKVPPYVMKFLISTFNK